MERLLGERRRVARGIEQVDVILFVLGFTDDQGEVFTEPEGAGLIELEARAELGSQAIGAAIDVDASRTFGRTIRIAAADLPSGRGRDADQAGTLRRVRGQIELAKPVRSHGIQLGASANSAATGDEQRVVEQRCCRPEARRA